ncbi:MAG: 3'(2'),5'-bisphosphate nucleotidase CysQ [Deltaproteobacteria bacterium]
MPDLIENCLTSALVAAKKAGDEILEVYLGDIDVTYKEDNSPLTLADMRAHRAISEILPALSRKDIPILSEEGKEIPYQQRAQWEYLWLVDPLDGTKEFVKRRDEFTVNIALIENNRPVVGVVFLPAVGSLYFAAEGLGSYKLEKIETVGHLLDGAGNSSIETIDLSMVVDGALRLPSSETAGRRLDQINLVGSRSHGLEALSDFVDKMKEKYDEVGFVPAGSALKFCLVAEGKADLYPRFGPTMEWDTAAGHCVVAQSGGVVVQMTEKTPLEYNKEDLHNPHFLCLGKEFKEVSLPL